MEDSVNREGLVKLIVTWFHFIHLPMMTFQNILQQKNTDILSSIFQVINGSSSAQIGKDTLFVNNLGADVKPYRIEFTWETTARFSILSNARRQVQL